jgi:hypothetical protein
MHPRVRTAAGLPRRAGQVTGTTIRSDAFRTTGVMRELYRRQRHPRPIRRRRGLAQAFVGFVAGGKLVVLFRSPPTHGI